MATIEFLALGRLDRVEKQMRRNLGIVRRRKLELERIGATPGRDPALDPLLAELRRMQLRLDLGMREIAADHRRQPVESEALTRAEGILAAAGEMIELLIWLGARPPGGVGRPAQLTNCLSP